MARNLATIACVVCACLGELLAGGPTAAAGAALGQAPCVGYQVSGAGTAAVNGCYKLVPQHVCEGSKGFVLDAKHELYEWKGTWRLGKCGAPHAAVFYAATHKSALPPETVSSFVTHL